MYKDHSQRYLWILWNNCFELSFELIVTEVFKINSEHLVASYSPSMFNNWVLSLIILNNQYISEVHSPIRKFGFCYSCLKLFCAEIEWGNAQSRCILQPLLSYISSSNFDYYVRTWEKQIGHNLKEIKQLIYCWKKIGVSSLLLSSLGILSKNKCKPKIIKNFP